MCESSKKGGNAASGDEIQEAKQLDTEVNGVVLHQFLRVTDERGKLSAVELEQVLPFTPRRLFVVYDVPSSSLRGEHAHHTCHQFLVCLSGTCKVMVDDGTNRQEFQLDASWRGLYVPPLIWAAQHSFSAEIAVLVLASQAYDASDYIRDYDEFLRAIQKVHE
jgi:UDP-2-acetamido-3-amino-2,3-dideoxy-glucuronate N-acetyltransferase